MYFGYYGKLDNSDIFLHAFCLSADNLLELIPMGQNREGMRRVSWSAALSLCVQ